MALSVIHMLNQSWSKRWNYPICWDEILWGEEFNGTNNPREVTCVDCFDRMDDEYDFYI